MQSLIQQCADIASLGHTLYASNDTACHGCTDTRVCTWHRLQRIRQRTLNRVQWRTMRTEQRRREWEVEQQDRDFENFRERYGYDMPYSIAQSMGYAE